MHPSANSPRNTATTVKMNTNTQCIADNTVNFIASKIVCIEINVFVSFLLLTSLFTSQEFSILSMDFSTLFLSTGKWHSQSLPPATVRTGQAKLTAVNNTVSVQYATKLVSPRFRPTHRRLRRCPSHLRSHTDPRVDTESRFHSRLCSRRFRICRLHSRNRPRNRNSA